MPPPLPQNNRVRVAVRCRPPFELDPHAIEARVMLRGAVPESSSSYNEMTLGQLADKARDKLAKQFAKS